jgi:hypothetical protein
MTYSKTKTSIYRAFRGKERILQGKKNQMLHTLVVIIEFRARKVETSNHSNSRYSEGLGCALFRIFGAQPWGDRYRWDKIGDIKFFEIGLSWDPLERRVWKFCFKLTSTCSRGNMYHQGVVVETRNASRAQPRLVARDRKRLYCFQGLAFQTSQCDNLSTWAVTATFRWCRGKTFRIKGLTVCG